MGGREAGGMATLLPAHRRLDNPAHRQEVAGFWNVTELPEAPGLTATRMFQELESGSLQDIWIMCTNPMASLTDANRVEAALKNARIVVVQDISDQNQALDRKRVVKGKSVYVRGGVGGRWIMKKTKTEN